MLRTALTAASAALVLLLPPLYAAQLAQRELPASPQLALPAAPGDGWALDAGPGLTDWRPTFQNPDRERTVQYRRGDEVVAVHLAWYGRQRQDAELINSRNFMIRQEHDVWSNVGERVVDTPAHPVRETRLRSTALRLLIHDWFVVGGEPTVSSVRAKLMFARSLLLEGEDSGYAVVLWTPQQGEDPAARARLAAFAAVIEPHLGKATAR